MPNSARQEPHLSPVSQSDMMSDWVSIQKAASLCDVSERTITRWIKRGRIMSDKRGQRRLVCRSSVEYLSSLARQDKAAESSCTEQLSQHQAELQTALHDITQLVCAMVELYHPNTLSDITRKRELHSEVERICAAHAKGVAHD